MRQPDTELEQMLAGKKAMSAFCRHSSESFDETGGQNFEPLVASGFIKKRKFFAKDHQGKNLIYTVYYTSGNDWRFWLYRELKKSMESGWCFDKEIIESLLLDYDNASIQQYIERIRG